MQGKDARTGTPAGTHRGGRAYAGAAWAACLTGSLRIPWPRLSTAPREVVQLEPRADVGREYRRAVAHQALRSSLRADP